MRAVIVAAVSTETQAAEDKASIPDQLAVCRKACRDHEWTVVREITIAGHSRDYVWLDDLLEDCPEYVELVDLVRAERVDVIVCRHYDRLWRTSFLQSQVGALCAQHRVQVYSVLQPQEPVPPERLHRRRGLSGIVELLSGALSEEEQRVRVERWHAGIAQRIEDGKPGCWVHAPTGYQLVDGELVIDQEWAPLVRWLFEQRAAGRGPLSMVRELNERGVASRRGGTWYLKAIQRILKNPTYIGAVFSGDHYNPNGNHEPLIGQALWDECRDVDRRLSRTPRRHAYVLSGLVRCGYCGWAMCYASWDTRVKLRCSQYLSSGGHECQSNSHEAHLLERPVLEAVQEALRDRDAWAARQRQRLESDGTERELRVLRTQRESAQDQRARLVDAYQIGDLPRGDLEERVAEIADRLTALDARIAELSTTRQQIEAFCDTLASMNGIVNRLPTLPPEDQNAVYRRLIDTIEVTRDDLILHWLV